MIIFEYYQAYWSSCKVSTNNYILNAQVLNKHIPVLQSLPSYLSKHSQFCDLSPSIQMPCWLQFTLAQSSIPGMNVINHYVNSERLMMCMNNFQLWFLYNFNMHNGKTCMSYTRNRQLLIYWITAPQNSVIYRSK